MSYHIDDTDGTTIPTAVKVEKTITLRELTVEEAKKSGKYVLAWFRVDNVFEALRFDVEYGIWIGAEITEHPDRVWELPEVEGNNVRP